MKNNKPKSDKSTNLPTLSKQTAGGIGGAAIGGLLGGPVGAVVGGVAGALVGNASAQGKRPIKKAVEAVRSTLHRSKTVQAGEKAAKNAVTKVDSAVATKLMGGRAKPAKAKTKTAAKSSAAKSAPAKTTAAKAAKKTAKKTSRKAKPAKKKK